MTLTPATMYWFTRLDGLSVAFAVATFLGTLAVIITTIGFVATSNSEYGNDREANNTIKSVLKWLVPTWLICLFGLLFTPTTKEIAMIYVVPHITESQIVKQDIPELYDLGVNALKDWLKKDNGGDNE